MRKLQIILLLGIICILACNDDELEYHGTNINIGISNPNSNGAIFTNDSLDFYCNLNNTRSDFPDWEVEWYLDNDVVIQEREFTYSYTETGLYRPSIRIFDGDVNVKLDVRNEFANNGEADVIGDWLMFKFDVKDPPKIYKTEEINEIGHHIFLKSDGYGIVYSAENKSKGMNLYLKSLDYDFEEVEEVRLNFDSSDSLVRIFRDDLDNLIIESDKKFYEFTVNGKMVKRALKDQGYTSVIPTLLGYVAVVPEGVKIRVDLLDKNFNVTSTNLVSFELGYNYECEIEDVEILENGNLFVLYLIDGYEQKLSEVTMEGFTISSKHISISSIEKVFPFSDELYIVGKGYRSFDIYILEDDYSYYREFSRMNVSRFISNSSLELIDNIIFYNNMEFMDLSGTMKTILSYSYDAFNDVIKNNEGNYVMLGTHNSPLVETVSYEYMEFKSDLLITVVDSKGSTIKISN